MKLITRHAFFDTYGDDYSEDVLVVPEDLDLKQTAPCLVFRLDSAGWDGEISIVYLGKYDYMKVLEVLRKVEHRINIEEELQKLDKLD